MNQELSLLLAIALVPTGLCLSAAAADGLKGATNKLSNAKIMLEPASEFGTGDKPEMGKAGGVRGMNPADNITKFELLPKCSRLDGENDVSRSTLPLNLTAPTMANTPSTSIWTELRGCLFRFAVHASPATHLSARRTNL